MNYLRKIVRFLAARNFFNFLNDKNYIKLIFWAKFGKKINLKNPQTFNEKLQWLKLNDRQPIYTKMVDKYEVKKYIGNLIGEEYIIPTLGIWDKFDDIDFDKLPDQFVLKCTHDSGGIYICKDKTTMNTELAKKKIEKSLKNNYYFHGREWPYKNVKPRIIAEEYMENKLGELIDYKLFCFNGKAKITLVCSERYSSTNMCETWYDNEWNLLPIVENNHRVDKNLKCPKNYKKMIKIAEEISKDIPFVRIDFYEINERIYFGEITFFPASGMERFDPEEWNYKLGEWIKIEKDD